MFVDFIGIKYSELSLKCQTGSINFIVRTDISSPFIFIGIHEFQSFLYLFQSDTTTAYVILFFRKITVGDFKMDGSLIIGFQRDMDKTGFCGADSMFEGILDERDKNEWRYFQVVFFGYVYIQFDLDLIRKPDTHQGNIILEKFYFMVQGCIMLVVFVEHMP